MDLETRLFASKTFYFEWNISSHTNPKQLLEEKEVYEQIGRTQRKKDTESKKILQQLIVETLF